MALEIIPLVGVPEIGTGDEIATLLAVAAREVLADGVVALTLRDPVGGSMPS